MKTVILCGGKGTRLREETEFRPKPMLPIGERPIVWHIMKTYASHGYKDFVLCLGYKGEMIVDYFRNYSWNSSDITLDLGNPDSVRFQKNTHDESDWKITLAFTGLESMTAYRIRLIKKYIGDDEEFMLTYGDGVSNVDIDALVEFHHKSGKVCTLTGVHPPGRFGQLSVADGSLVTQFSEKPQAEGGYINGGYMVCNKRMFDYLPEDPGMMLEDSPMRTMTADRQLAVFRHEGFWQPMDTFAEFNYLNKLWTENKAPWKIW
jgi:glucose-1-phosphate cytidylyltransferase